jgi:phage recombination protein Bet
MNALVQFQAPRLPYHPVVEERFGVDKTSWKALVEAVFPSAKSVDSVVMALAYCKRRNLDVFKRPVHIVPVWDSNRREMVETVWPGISEMRTTAMRTGQYAGKDKTQFGPDVTTKLGGVEVTFPEWAQITLYRMVPGAGRCAFEGPQVHWTETYATAKKDTEAPNTMWRKRPRGQIEKCAEAAALRCTFPEELGNEYAAEEMEGKSIGADGGPITAVDQGKPRTLHADFEAHDETTGEIIEATVEEIDEALDGDRIPAEITDPGAQMMTGADLAARQAAEQEATAQVEAASGDLALDTPSVDPELLERAECFKRGIANMDAEEARGAGNAVKGDAWFKTLKEQDREAAQGVLAAVAARLTELGAG